MVFDSWRGVITILLFIIVGYCLFIVLGLIPSVPMIDEQGNVILDQFARAKDILLVVLPLLSVALGYWFGVRGVEKAEAGRDEATDKLAATGAELAQTQRRFDALTMTDTGRDLLRTAKENNPDLFGV